jgi:AcrR family transcriptional regulator
MLVAMRTVNPQQHALKRSLILEAAAQEFAAHGLDGTSTAAICARAGIGSGTLFHYFGTKREIFLAMFSDDLAANKEVCQRAIASTPPAAGLDLLVDHLVRDLADPLIPGLMAAALLQANRDEEFAALLVADDDTVRSTLVELLVRMRTDGHLLAFEPAEVARWIQRVIDASFLTADDPSFEPGEHAVQLRQIIGWLTGRGIYR